MLYPKLKLPHSRHFLPYSKNNWYQNNGRLAAIIDFVITSYLNTKQPSVKDHWASAIIKIPSVINITKKIHEC